MCESAASRQGHIRIKIEIDLIDPHSTVRPLFRWMLALLTRIDGYHLSELNFPVTSLTCLPSAVDTSKSLLPKCLGLDANRYSLVTAIFTVGGLGGSLGSSWLVQKKGLKGGLVYVAWMNVLGVALMAFSPNWLILTLGRCVFPH